MSEKVENANTEEKAHENTEKAVVIKKDGFSIGFIKGEQQVRDDLSNETYETYLEIVDGINTSMRIFKEHESRMIQVYYQKGPLSEIHKTLQRLKESSNYIRDGLDRLDDFAF